VSRRFFDVLRCVDVGVVLVSTVLADENLLALAVFSTNVTTA
jgi:hypothetical protein